MGRFSCQAKNLHKRQDAAALAVRGGMGVSQANPPGVLSPARSSHHHQLSDLAWPLLAANTNNRFLLEQENSRRPGDI